MSLDFELGGVRGWCPEGHITVNLVEPADIICDIRDVDAYCPESQADLFRLSHTLEHIPSQHYVQFLKDLLRKLAPGGCVEVIQTDVERLLEKKWPLRVARLPIFSPADRLRENPHHLHYNMWSAAMLVEDLVAVGYDRVEEFDAGGWKFDQRDELYPEITDCYQGMDVPNLGVRAYRGDPLGMKERQSWQ